MRCKLLPSPEKKGILLDWKRENGQPLPRGSTVDDGTLYLIDLRKEDSGNYICFGIDLHGRRIFSAKTQLNVVGMFHKIYSCLMSRCSFVMPSTFIHFLSFYFF